MALTQTQLDELREIDTPTILNAIETFGVRPNTLGFTGTNIDYLAPDMGVMLGYAVTALGDTMSEDAPKSPDGMFQMWEAVDETPNPVVLVIKDFGDDPTHSVHAGDGMATLAHVLGADGIVTDRRAARPGGSEGGRDQAVCARAGPVTRQQPHHSRPGAGRHRWDGRQPGRSGPRR